MVSEVESSATRSTPRLPAPQGSPSTGSAGVDDSDIRVSLSPAALKSADLDGSREIAEYPATASTPAPERETSDSTPRRHPIDAYRETPRAPRGERVRIVV